MIIILALTILAVVGYFLFTKTNIFEKFGLIILAISSFLLLLSIIAISIKGYDYNNFNIRREAFTETLNEARKNNNPIELAAITSEISKFNQDLAEKKYNRSIFLFHYFIDKRIDLLKPIK